MPRIYHSSTLRRRNPFAAVSPMGAALPGRGRPARCEMKSFLSIRRLALLGFVLGVGSLHAQTILTLTVVDNFATVLGYTLNSTYTFSFTLSPLANSGGSTFWQGEPGSPLLSGINGTGVQGTFTAADGTSSNDTIVLVNPLRINFNVENTTISQIGTLKTLEPIGVDPGKLQIFDIGLYFSNPVVTGSIPVVGGSTVENAATFFAGYTGTYSLTNQSFLQFNTLSGSTLNLLPTSLTITTVPEPPVTALFGTGLFSLACWRRWKNRRRSR